MRISDWSSDVSASDLDRAHLHLVVVGVDVGPHLDFLNLDDLLLFPGLVLLLLGLVAETAVVENLANRWLGVGRNLHEVQSGTLRPAPGIGGRYDAEPDRKKDVSGKSVSVSVDLGGRRIIKK